MAPTSDERREVAEILRMSAKETNGTRDFAMYLSHWVGLEGITDDKGNPFTIAANRREAELTLEKLADLIDPTCHMTDSMWDNGECTWGCICSACGACIEHECASGIDYCPRCGARVVRE